MIQKCAARFRFHLLTRRSCSAAALALALGLGISLSSPAAAAASYSVNFEGPSALCALAEQHSEIARFQSQDDVSSSELSRLISEAPVQLGKLFATEGYFNSVIRVERAASGVGLLPQLRVIIEAGPQTQIAAVELTASGAITQVVDETSGNRTERIDQQWALSKGSPFRQNSWSDAKNTLLTSLWVDRYPAARIVNSQATIDADANLARLKVEYDSGPLFLYGETQVSGLVKMPRSVVDNLSGLQPGQPYVQKQMLDFQDRLLGSGLFDSATVQIEPDPALAGAVPVQIQLRERAMQTLILGLGYSTLSGPRATVEHSLLRVFDFDWQVKTTAKLARDDRSFSTEFLSYPLPNFYRNLFAASLSRLDAGGMVIIQEQMRAGRRYDADRITRLYYLAAIRDTTNTLEPLSGSALLYNYEWRYLSVDSPLFPTRGFAVTAQGGGGVRFGKVNSGQPFLRTTGRFNLYQPLGGLWLSQLRVEVGQVLTNKPDGIPQTLLFRAGGIDSVRGYGRQSLGVVGPGYAAGGRFLLTGSAEIAREIIPTWYGAVFVDVGDAARQLSDWSAKFGYGVGVRWRSPVGPVKADISYGQAVKKFRLDVSVGVTF
ncbi:MAG: BamA/TamA family outer membrane protein [Rhizobacter sp.]|nr:BamA/TamA family outer membrane protein [Burkholderiales bacterium]